MPFAALLTRLGGLLLCLCGIASFAQDDAPEKCAERATYLSDAPYVDNLRWCVESVIHAPHIEPFAFTALEAAADGALLATRPLAGEVSRIIDTDGDALPDTLETYADGLILPNGLALHHGDLYVAGGAYIWRINGRGAVEIVTDDLPSGSGFWTGGLAIGADERLYVAIGAPCDRCAFDDPQRGAIISMRLDGSDRRIAASGFRRPSDLALYRGALWTLDSMPYGSTSSPDALIRLDAGGWYGYPPCAADADCAPVTAPAMTFGNGAVPVSLAHYPHDSLTGVEDTLLVVLGGEPTQTDTVGYKLLMIHFDDADQSAWSVCGNALPLRKRASSLSALQWNAAGLCRLYSPQREGLWHVSAPAAGGGGQRARLDLP